MDDAQKLAAIRNCLGPNTEPFSVVVAGRPWSAYRAPSRASLLRPFDAKSAHAYYDTQIAEARDIALNATLRAAGVHHFLGDGGDTIFAIPDLPPIDVIEFAKVGTHNGSPDGWRQTQALLRATVARVAFDIVFADEAGLDARTTEPIDAATARAWDSALLDAMEADQRWLDSYTFMLNQAEERGLEPDAEGDPRGGGAVAAFIVATRSVRLWWD